MKALTYWKSFTCAAAALCLPMQASYARFLQTDPVGYADQINLYAYTHNDPVNMVDTSGSWSRKVHNQIFAAAVGHRLTGSGLGVVQRRSLYQDVPRLGNGSHNRMHFLRNPGENAAAAKSRFSEYVDGQLSAARRFVGIADETRALQAFANAAHAIADSYSPAHNEGGQPAAYDPEWGPVDAARNGHSPLNAVGREGSDNLTAQTRRQIVSETRKAFDSVFGSASKEKLVECTGSRILRASC